MICQLFYPVELKAKGSWSALWLTWIALGLMDVAGGPGCASSHILLSCAALLEVYVSVFCLPDQALVI